MFDYEEYLEQEKMYHEENPELFVYYNPHPEGKEVNDCVKRSLTKATGKDYKEIQLELNRYKKITKAKTFNERKNWVPFVEKVIKAKKLSGYLNMKIGEFCKENPKGTYIIKCRKHTVTVVDGKIYDTWNSTFKAINRVWEVID